ncbi:K(+) efflux antiporter 5-like isoform X3 [Pyrus communis]|uniref:K(+) efflux antiporter 5-like isoform X3 n=1 Tax=Pyrus communis TaxID=23211 RepID=UPI0035C1FA60
MAKRRRCVFGFCYSLLTILVYARVSFSARSDKEVRERFYGNMMNSSAPVSGDGTIAKMFDRVLEKEFSENDQPEGSDGASFNSSVADQQAVLETVAKITHEKGKKNDTQVGNGTKPYDFEGVFSLENEDSEETTTLIDKKVETVAQFGVVFLLFALGLEFSLAKLKAVGPVAVLGGLLQIMTFMLLCAITAVLCGAKLSEGIFVGSFLSMSSTAVVVKFLAERNSNSALHGQVTIGTLIFQDCAVGLLFALLPVLGGHSGLFQGMVSVGKLFLVLSLYLGAASVFCWSFVPRFLKLMMQLSSQTNELYQLAVVAFCLLSAWCSDKLGLSLELGSFVAGVMISTTDLAQHTLDQVEPIRNLFAALFLSSIGMLIHVHFLWSHVDILLASVILVIVVKTAVATIVTKAFGYSFRTSFVVGVSLAQIGEFAFVLLSRASNLKLVEGKMYLLLLGTTALSLVTTPLLFKLTPAITNLGVLMHWFPSEGTPYNEVSLSPSLKHMHAYLQASYTYEV